MREARTSLYRRRRPQFVWVVALVIIGGVFPSGLKLTSADPISRRPQADLRKLPDVSIDSSGALPVEWGRSETLCSTPQSTALIEPLPDPKRMDLQLQNPQPVYFVIGNVVSRGVSKAKGWRDFTHSHVVGLSQKRVAYNPRMTSGRNWRTANLLQFHGGANSPQESSVSEELTADSGSSTTGDHDHETIGDVLKGVYLGNDILLQRAILQAKASEMVNRVRAGLEAMQKTSYHVAPRFLTLISVLYASDGVISFLSLYGLSLLGASCGFYLLLYFITFGYALGVGLPLTVSLYVYNVRIGIKHAKLHMGLRKIALTPLLLYEMPETFATTTCHHISFSHHYFMVFTNVCFFVLERILQLAGASSESCQYSIQNVHPLRVAFALLALVFCLLCHNDDYELESSTSSSNFPRH